MNDEEERGRDEPADRSQAPAPSVNLSICAPRPPPPDSATTITSKSLFRYKSGKWSPTVCDGIPCSKCTEQMQRSKLNRWKGQADRLLDWTKSRHKSKIMFFYTLDLLLSRFRGASIRIRPLLLPLWILGLVLRQLARGGRMKMNTKYWILNTCFETICKRGPYENENATWPPSVLASSACLTPPLRHIHVCPSEYFTKVNISVSEYFNMWTGRKF